MTNDWLNTLFPPNAERTLPWPLVGDTVTLWRPTGLHGLRLLAQSGWKAWPSKLPDQPLFYPVLNRLYTKEIARNWNARRNAPAIGLVTEFEIRANAATHYKIQIVGAQNRHQELWRPAEELARFNAAIIGPIQVVAHFPGEDYMGAIDLETHLPEDFR